MHGSLHTMHESLHMDLGWVEKNNSTTQELFGGYKACSHQKKHGSETWVGKINQEKFRR